MFHHIREMFWACKEMWGFREPRPKTIRQQLRATGRPSTGILHTTKTVFIV